MVIDLCLVVIFAEIMGKKGGRDWFNIARNKTEGSSSITARPKVGTKKVLVVVVDDRSPSHEQTLSKKRKVDRVVVDQRSS